MAKQRKPIPAYTKGIPVTKERRRQNGGVVTEAIHQKDDGKIYTRRHRAKFESVLDVYLWHEIISEPQNEAGKRFGREYTRSVLKIKVYDGSGNHGDPEMAAISAINGNKVLRRAFDALTPAQRAVMIAVCVDNSRAGTTRRLDYLCKALQKLAKLWNML